MKSDVSELVAKLERGDSLGKEDISVIRSARKSLSVTIKDGKVIVRAPYAIGDKEIEDFLRRHRRWLATHLQKEARQKETAGSEGRLTNEELNELADRALKVIPPKVNAYAKKMGVTYGRITIRNQKTRWGSCSSKGNLNFNCLLMLCPDEVIDAVVVHELAHRKEMNHSDRFYAIVRRTYPEYDRWNRWLKENGPVLMERMR